MKGEKSLAKAGKFMKVLVSGSTGLIGSELIPYLNRNGYATQRLVRGSATGDVRWDPEAGTIEKEKLNTIDAVVHLAGENIAAGRWNEERKKKILESRVKGTKLLAESLAALTTSPKVMICASASGYYGDRGEEILREDSSPGTGFLTDVCKEWEAAAEPARQKGIRVVHVRIGILLTPKGGALGKMIRPFKLGVGGRLGSGKQYWSWIAIDDLLRVIEFALTTDPIQGPVNTVTPNPVTNAEFTRTLSKVLRRPAIFPAPAVALKLALGEMAQELLLSSFRMEPARLISSGFVFHYPELEGALHHVLS